MKVLFDANVFLSFMLAPDEDRTITRIVRAALTADGITVVVPPDLIDEIVDKTLHKPFLQGKIPQAMLEEHLSLLLTDGDRWPPFRRNMRPTFGTARTITWWRTASCITLTIW